MKSDYITVRIGKKIQEWKEKNNESGLKTELAESIEAKIKSNK
jgi:hypothetical protein